VIYSMYSCFSFRRRKKNWVAAKKRDTYEKRYKLLIFVWKWNVNISTDKATHGTAEKRNINSSAHRASYHTNEKEKKRTSWRWVWMQEFFFEVTVLQTFFLLFEEKKDFTLNSNFYFSWAIAYLQYHQNNTFDTKWVSIVWSSFFYNENR